VRPEATVQDVNSAVMSNLDAAYRLARWHFREEREAEDVVHAAAVRALRACATVDTETARAWFLRIVRGVCSERSAGSQTTLTEALDDQAGGVMATARPQASITDLLSIEQAIRRLPPGLREVLVLRDIEGLSYQELAAVLGVSVATVTTCVSRSRQALHGVLTSQTGFAEEKLASCV
jgi:RNA polymerase sigma factor (sigma-70 family)